MLMPSLGEGFGLPILDAFACGTPVLCSNVSSMPEVAGGGAEYCNPRSVLSIAEGIQRLSDPANAAELVQRGRERLAAFSWQRTARAMVEVYERAAAADATAGRTAAMSPLAGPLAVREETP
jgi:alpha-1,3-rhamnosyl/mannosyltransferase